MSRRDSILQVLAAVGGRDSVSWSCQVALDVHQTKAGTSVSSTRQMSRTLYIPIPLALATTGSIRKYFRSSTLQPTCTNSHSCIRLRPV